MESHIYRIKAIAYLVVLVIGCFNNGYSCLLNCRKRRPVAQIPWLRYLIDLDLLFLFQVKILTSFPKLIIFFQLPLYLYLLRDLHKKLDYFNTKCNGLSAASGFTGVTLEEFLNKIRPLFPSLKRHLDSAMSILKEGMYAHSSWSRSLL